MTISPNPYRGFRFPPAVIEHAVWLYHCFSLSLRDVELILAGRGIVVSYESIREWSLRFGRIFANALKRAGHNPATSGTGTRCSSGSAASNTIFGARSRWPLLLCAIRPGKWRKESAIWPAWTSRTSVFRPRLVFLLYQKGRDSRIFQAQDGYNRQRHSARPARPDSL